MSTVIDVAISTSTVGMLVGMIMVILPLVSPWERPAYYLKTFLWQIGFVLLGTGMASISWLWGIIGFTVMALMYVAPETPPVLYFTMFFGGLGSLLLGRAL